MPPEASTLGSCPACGTEIPADQLLIEYEKADRRTVYAECPSCTDPVHPE